MSLTVIPIFYACDDAFSVYTAVSLRSLICNASREYDYHVHILNAGLSSQAQSLLSAYADDRFSIFFDDVTEYLKSIAHKFPIRDYYNNTTYYRLFIAEMFPQYNKVVYIDSDAVVLADVSRLFNVDIHNAYVGACHEQVMIQQEVFGTYVEKVIGISRFNFFNAGVLLINCNQFRMQFVLDLFIRYLHTYEFVVTQDEDYLNLICKDHVYWLDQRWNTEVYGELSYPVEQAYILHYIMANKPWHYKDCRYADFFWQYARQTQVCALLCRILDSYTDEQKQRDSLAGQKLMQLAVSETNRPDNYLNSVNKISRAPDRIAILHKMEQYEREGRFEEDIEDDPPSKMLMPDDIEYIHKNFNSRVKTKLAFMLARQYLQKLLADKKMIVREIRGIENFRNLDSGAVITCNHFNALDSFAIQMAYEMADQPERTFYRIIREGNYTSFPGFYGFLMRNCNTLPLSSNLQTMRKLIAATTHLLLEGNFVLVYPEQSMWWNYRKPKPLKKGAYMFACRSGVPVLPCFITMQDSDIVGDDGFFVQEYTIHIGKPIYPDVSATVAQNERRMMEENYRVWKDIYEQEYHIPLTYTTEKQVESEK